MTPGDGPLVQFPGTGVGGGHGRSPLRCGTFKHSLACARAAANSGSSQRNPFSTTVGITGTFEIDPGSQTIIAVNVTLSNLPPQLSWFSVFNTVLNSFLPFEFLAIDAPHDGGFQPRFSAAFG